MAKNVRTILGVACRDYLHERLLSACAVLGLVAALSPLLILYGVKYGLVQTLTERLLQDPRNLEITPVSSGKFTADYLARLQAHPDVIFVVPRTRSISATMTLRGASGDSRRELVASLEPSGPGDPLLARYAAAFSPMPSNLAAESIGITISATIAEKLGLAPNDRLWGRVERRYRGAAETARVSLHVAGILPLAAQQKDVIYAPLPLVQATEDYRDGRGVPELGEHNGWSGDPLPREERTYPGFRLHARSLEAVVALRAAFAAQNIEVYTRAEEIEQVTSLSRTLDLIFALICAATAAGFLASTASSVLAGIKRKERILGLLRLNGFTTVDQMDGTAHQKHTTGKYNPYPTPLASLPEGFYHGRTGIGLSVGLGSETCKVDDAGGHRGSGDVTENGITRGRRIVKGPRFGCHQQQQYRQKSGDFHLFCIKKIKG